MTGQQALPVTENSGRIPIQPSPAPWPLPPPSRLSGYFLRWPSSC
ncbi:hypothetical protein ACFFX0_31770 [Citricoccus parietis]|uniref:Uncharacterized protein n=1 Tax=Citricoccus parietis TaxID=592307 RepID=A0ABV5G994_9MICC